MALDRLEALVRNRLKRLQYRPGTLDGFIAGTGLALDEGGVRVRGCGTQPVPSVTTVTDTNHYGRAAVATAWDRLHPLLVRRSAWADHSEAELPVVEGTVIRRGSHYQQQSCVALGVGQGAQ